MHPPISYSRRPLSRTRSPRARRQGMAPLEMVLCLPILVFMFVLAVWMANFFIAQARLTASVRNSAWQKRYREAASNAYDFTGSSGLVQERNTRDVPIAKMFGAMPDARSSHMVFGDSWCARDPDASAASQARFQDLNTHWNSDLQVKLVGLTGKQVGDIFNNLEFPIDAIGDMILKAIEDGIVQVIKNQLGPVLGELLGLGQSEIQKAEEKRDEQRQQARNEIERLNGEIMMVDMQIEAKMQEVNMINEQIKEIDDRLKRADDPQKEEDKLTDEQEEQLKKDREELVKKRNQIQNVDLPNLRKQREILVKQRQVQEKLLSA